MQLEGMPHFFAIFVAAVYLGRVVISCAYDRCTPPPHKAGLRPLRFKKIPELPQVTSVPEQHLMTSFQAFFFFQGLHMGFLFTMEAIWRPGDNIQPKKSTVVSGHFSILRQTHRIPKWCITSANHGSKIMPHYCIQCSCNPLNRTEHTILGK